MSIKKFLKPDWRKIVIFVILFLITTFVPFFTAEAYNMTSGERFISRFSLANILFNCFWGNIYENFLYKQECSQSIQFFVLLIILDYLLSCFIVWIYDKFRKKR